MVGKIKISIKTLATSLFYLLVVNANAIAGDTCDTGNARDCLANGKPGEIMQLLNIAINALAVSVGVLAVITLIVSGIQYTASSGDPQKVANTKKRIYGVIIGLVAFVFLYAFMQWLIPGGLY